MNTGDHAIISEVCYSATNLFFREYLPKKYNIEVTFVDTTDTEAVKNAMRPNTKLIHVETPGNPTTGISDISAIAEIAHKGGSLLSVDATFAGPICLYPIKLGAEEAPWVCLTLCLGIALGWVMGWIAGPITKMIDK